MASNLKEFYEFLKDPTNTASQNKIRNVDFEQIEPLVQEESRNIKVVYSQKYASGSYEDFLQHIKRHVPNLLKTVQLLLAVVDGQTQFSNEDIKSVITFVTPCGFVKSVEKILETNMSVATHDLLNHALTSAATSNQKTIAGVVLRKDTDNTLTKKTRSRHTPIYFALLAAVANDRMEVQDLLFDFLTQKEIELTADEYAELLSEAYKHARVQSVEKILKRPLTSEEAGDLLAVRVGSTYTSLLDHLEELLKKDLPQNKIDEAFDIVVKKIIEKARLNNKSVILHSTAKLLLKKISTAQIDKTLNDTIGAPDFNFVPDILAVAPSEQIGKFLMRLLDMTEEGSFLDNWLKKWDMKLAQADKEKIYLAAQKKGAVTIMQHIKQPDLLPDDIGESLVAVIENQEISSLEQLKVVRALLEAQPQPSSNFIDKALIAASRCGQCTIVEALYERATSKSQNEALVVAVESYCQDTVKMLRKRVTDKASINRSLDFMFGEQQSDSKLMIVTCLLGNEEALDLSKCTPRRTKQLSASISTLKAFEKKGSVIKEICSDLSHAEKALQLGCQLEDVQTYLSMMKTKEAIVEAKSLFPYNLKTVQNTLTALLSIIGCLSVIAIPIVYSALNDNLKQRGGMFRFFHKGDKQALEIVEHKFNALLEKKDTSLSI